MKIKKWNDTLVPGDVIATGESVVTATVFYGTIRVVYSSGRVQEWFQIETVTMMEETNCLYGGLAVGHRVNCTADSCA